MCGLRFAMISLLHDFYTSGGALGAIVLAALAILLLRFLDYLLFASRPPAGSEADARFPDDAALAAELERHYSHLAALDEAQLHDAAGALPFPPAAASAAPISKRPRGSPPPAGGEGGPPQRPKLSAEEARAQLKRFAESEFVRGVLGGDTDEEGEGGAPLS